MFDKHSLDLAQAGRFLRDYPGVPVVKINEALGQPGGFSAHPVEIDFQGFEAEEDKFRRALVNFGPGTIAVLVTAADLDRLTRNGATPNWVGWTAFCNLGRLVGFQRVVFARPFPNQLLANSATGPIYSVSASLVSAWSDAAPAAVN